MTRSFALAVVTGAMVFGSAGLAGADQNAGPPPTDPPGGVLVPGDDHGSDSGGNGRGGVGNGPDGGGHGPDGGGHDAGGPADGGSGEGADERRGGDDDRRPCQDDRRSRGELAVDPDHVASGRGTGGDELEWDLGEGGFDGPPGWVGRWSQCEDPPQAPTDPGTPPRSEPDHDVHADPDRGDTGPGPEAGPTGAPNPHAADEPGVSAPESTAGSTTDSTAQPADGSPPAHGSSAPVSTPVLQRAETGTGDGDDGAAAAGGASDDGGIGFGGGLLLIGGGGLLAAAAAAILAARTRRT
ncbi:hypothetical protein FHS23_001692 [Prauserella isguenensis]|uniref:Gram-positive cocci surface proteins LPxTG domain-containing protein n=1 Tax=Prauserella isguenensis TaxID=1470180 RepID=A0A839S1U4_9PSEU|nr:hypothetical protein [Prauserella isguenensis]MBB3050697.1 hypothetical protein [Prauserella isguenensis]